LRSDGANLFLKFGVLVLEVRLLRFDLCQLSSHVLDGVTLLCYDLCPVRDKPGDFIQVRAPFTSGGGG
jgi:hypothetical protein